MVAERVVDVLEAVEVEIGDDRALAGPLRHGAVEERLDLLDHMHAVRQAGQCVVLRFVAGLRFAVSKRGRRALEAVEHRLRQEPGREHTKGHERENDGQQRSAGLPRDPAEIAKQNAIIADEGLRDILFPLSRFRPQFQIAQKQRLADLGDEGLVDIGDAGGWACP